jgi:DNA-binding transcriptional MocR family regulator
VTGDARKRRAVGVRDVVARVLVAPGDVVAVEDPGYAGALPRTARLVYVTPSHQWPLGVVMVLPRRLAQRRHHRGRLRTLATSEGRRQ